MVHSLGVPDLNPEHLLDRLKGFGFTPSTDLFHMNNTQAILETLRERFPPILERSLRANERDSHWDA
jgi:hypothetical protein